VTSVSFYEPVRDDQLAPVGNLDRLLAIKFHGTRITDAGLDHLRHLKTLREVQLEGTRITDAGLARLKPLAGLREAAPALIVSHRRFSLLSGPTARQERARRRWDEDWKKTHEEMKKFMKEYEANGAASIPLPSPPPLLPEE